MKNLTSTTIKRQYSLIALYWLIIASAVFFLVKVHQDMQAALPTDQLMP